MLKRVLTIGILAALALSLMAVGPPVQEPSPAEAPTFPAPTYAHRSADNMVEYDTGTEIITLFWGTYTGEWPNSPSRLTNAPVGDKMDMEIPEEALALLPSDRRAKFERFNEPGGATAYASDDDDQWECARRISYPYRSGSYVNAYGGISCLGNPITHTRVSVILTRGSYMLKDYDSKWKTWKSHGRTIKGPCAIGTYQYKNRVWTGMRFQNGTEDGEEATTTSIIRCE